MKNIYIIDTCSLISASKYYTIGKKSFEHIWNKFDELIESGLLLSTSEVKEEVKDKDLSDWIDKHKRFYIPLNKEIQEKVKIILSDFPLLIKIRSTSNSNADPFIVATAIEYNAIVITDEIKSGSSADPHIPNACEKYKIKYMKLVDFINSIFD